MKRRHNNAHDEPHTDESWLIPYADILTLLLALFVILFAISHIDQKKYERVMYGFIAELTGGTGVLREDPPFVIDPPDIPNPGLDQKRKDMEEMKNAMDIYISENGLSSQLETWLSGDRDMLRITIRDYALFDSGSATIKPESQQLARYIADMLSRYPAYNVEIAGHTDNVPIHTAEFESNWDLSARRSLNFLKYILLGTDNVNQKRFRTIGYGEFQPIATNDTVEGRSKNRRVEINIEENR